MKKLILALLLLVSVSTHAQVTLEHSYTSDENAILIYNLEGVGNRYVTYNRISNRVNFYDGNHTLWKSIDPKIPTGYTLSRLTEIYPSTKLFDLDAGVEMLIIYDTMAAGPKYFAHIVDESGAILNVFPNAQDAYIQRFDTTWKLLLWMYDLNSTTKKSYSEVYSLPGQFLGVRSPNGNNNNDPADHFYPNPMDNVATLEYTLPNSAAKGTVQIFSSTGTMVRTYPINQNTGKLIIQRDGLPAGAYFISTTSNGVASPPQKIAMY
jgi:hypothetical protein